METPKSNDNNIEATEFKIFATKRVIAGILLIAVALWVVGTVFGFFEKPAENYLALPRHQKQQLCLGRQMF